MKKYGFFKTFISVCSGTAVFPEIVKFPFRRMVWHLFILAVLGGLVNVAFRYHPFNVVYEESCTKLQKKFGDIDYSEKGLRPTVNPTQQGTAYLQDFRVDYFPNVEDLKNFKPEEDPFYGIAWTPYSISIWIMYEGNQLLLCHFLFRFCRKARNFIKVFHL